MEWNFTIDEIKFVWNQIILLEFQVLIAVHKAVTNYVTLETY